MTTENMPFTAKYPEFGTGPVSTESALSQEQFELEREHMFRRSWLNIGRVDQVKQAGDYFVYTIPTFDIPVLVVKGKDEQVRAFYNICSHRQFSLVLEDRGNCSDRFACKLHGWTYNSAGDLIGMTGIRGFCNVDKKDNGLTEINSGVWHGFIFVHLMDTPEQSLEEFLSSVNEYFEDYPFQEMVRTYEYASKDHGNWKTAMNAQSEVWHVPFLHDESAYPLLASKETRRARKFPVQTLDCAGPHRIIGMPAPGEGGEPNPAAMLAYKYGAAALFGDMTEETTGPKYKMTREVGAGNAGFYLFPSLEISCFEDSYFLFRIWPLTADSCLWEFFGYGYPSKIENAGHAFARQYAAIVSRDTYREDVGAHGLVQKNLKTRAKPHVHFHDEELLLRHVEYIAQEYTKGK